MGPFDPHAVAFLRLVCFRSGGFTMEIDDIDLCRGGAGWRYSPEERRDLGIDVASPRFRIADFERETSMSGVSARASRISRVTEGGKPRSHVLRWETAGGGGAGLRISQVPEDLADYRYLRFRARADGKVSDRIAIGFLGERGDLSRSLEGIGRRWRDFEIPLPEMSVRDGFDPAKTSWLYVAIYDATECVYEMDDLVLVKDAGGWQRTEAEQRAHVFGEDRARKVKEIGTEHFLVSTDSAAARRKFPRALEKVYDFACEELGLSGFTGRLPVYIFQNANLYQDFCVRSGWSRKHAEQTAGHAGASYFATYYQAPESATVTHELTHSIFHRAIGRGGGSWFQEGVAVYVEERWRKRSAAKVFAPRLRSGEFVPLAEFVRIDALVRQEDVKGGARTAGPLYEQAGAFFEFLFRGPPSETRPGAIRALAVLDAGDPGYVPEIERILGAPLSEIEAGWRDWGGDPPKMRRR